MLISGELCEKNRQTCSSSKLFYINQILTPKGQFFMRVKFKQSVLTALAFWMLWGIYPLHAQFDRDGAWSNEHSHKHTVLAEFPFWKNDVVLGLTYRKSVVHQKFLGFTVSFYGRPFGKDILLSADKNYYFQLKEFRYILAGGFDKKFWLSNKLDAFLGAAMGVSFVNYRGAIDGGEWKGYQIEKKQGLTPVIRAGMTYKFNRNIFIRMGYQYMDMKTVDGHRLLFAFGGQI